MNRVAGKPKGRSGIVNARLKRRKRAGLPRKAEREVRERAIAEQQARPDALLGKARAWQDTALIRAYVDARRQRESFHEPSKWVEWALAEADRIDPLIT